MQHPCPKEPPKILNLNLCQPSKFSPHPVESRASLPHHTSYLLFSPSLPSDSPLPVIQRLRVGVEFVRCIRNNNTGRLSTPILLLPCGCSLQSLPTRHPPSEPLQQFINPSFLLIIRPLITATWPRLPRHHLSFTFSEDQHPLPSPPTVDLIPQPTRIVVT